VDKKYRALDVVEFDGASFISTRDGPGLPGHPDDGWQLLCGRGFRGPVGDTGARGRKGERGQKGEATPTIINWTVDAVHYRLVPTLSNGTQGAAIELRPLLQQFLDEAISPMIDDAADSAVKDAARKKSQFPFAGI
jgi:hypothetical protein